MLNNYKPNDDCKKVFELLSLTLKAYQSIDEEGIRIPMNKIAILVGPNSSGKSAISDALNSISNVCDYRDLMRKLSANWKTSGGKGAFSLELDFDVSMESFFDRIGSRGLYDLARTLAGKKFLIEVGQSMLRLSINGAPLFSITPETSPGPVRRAYEPIVGDPSLLSEMFDDSCNEYIGDSFCKWTATVHHMQLHELTDLEIGGFSTEALWDALWERKRVLQRYSKESLMQLSQMHNDDSAATSIPCDFHSGYDYPALFARWTNWIDMEGFKILKYAVPWLSSNYGEEFASASDLCMRYPSLDESKLSLLWAELGADEDRWISEYRDVVAMNEEILRLLGEMTDHIIGFVSSNMQNSYYFVPGDRAVIDSSIPYLSYPLHKSWSWQDPMLSKRLYGSEEGKSQIQRFMSEEFARFLDSTITYNFLKHLPSLSSYSIKDFPEYQVGKVEVRNWSTLTPPPLLFSDEDSAFAALHSYHYYYVKCPDGEIRNFREVGSGISYIFPCLVGLAFAPISLIQQPELHLHPKAQCEIGDVLISAYNDEKFCVVETHSEHLILRLLRRIRETSRNFLMQNDLKISPQAVSIFYFEPDLKSGLSSVSEIRIDENGDFLDVWPGGFFSEREGELF